MSRRVFVFLLLMLSWGLGFANPAVPTAVVNESLAKPVVSVSLGADSARVNLSRKLSWLKDASGSLTLDDVRQGGQFVPLERELSEGFTAAVVWLRLDVVMSAAQPDHIATTTWILEVANALLDDVRLYSPQRDGSYLEQRSGEDVPRSAWPVDYRNPAFQVQIDGGAPQHFYLRIASRNALSTAITLWQPDKFSTASRDEGFNYGFFYGVYVLILVFHLFFWWVTREQLGGWYVPYVLLNFVGAAISTGHLQRLTGMPGQASDMLLGVMLCMPLAISNTFVLLQMELATKMPRFTRIYQPLGWTAGIGFSLGVLADYYGPSVGAAQIIMLLCIAVMICIGVYLALKGHRPARFFLFAFGFFYVAVVLRFLRNLGILEPSLLTEYAVPVGALLHMVVMSLGITGQYNQIKREKLSAQAALNQSLESQVAERTDLLVKEIARREVSESEARRALEVELQSRQEHQDFIAMVSHEFRTPLAIINTVTQQLASSPDTVSAKSSERCGDIRDATKRMSDMMDEFLTLDRLGGDLKARISVFSPADLLRSIVNEFADQQMDTRYMDLPAEVHGDSELLRVAIRNLIGNALRYAPAETCVKILAQGKADGGWQVVVEDAGAGIASDEIPKLFQKYFRGRAAQSKPGAGLGLYLVDRIARLHGGSVGVDSDPGMGCRFVFALPGKGE
jgi:signal transduction histidine kinase